MPFLVLLIGAILIIAAWRNTHGQLFSALGQDVPGFLKWALAVVAIGMLGYVPGLKPISRMLLALVIVVIVLTNYEQLFKGFTSLASSTPSSTTGEAEVATQYAQAAGTAAPTTVATNTSTSSTNVAANTTSNPFDPQSYLAEFEHGFAAITGTG